MTIKLTCRINNGDIKEYIIQDEGFTCDEFSVQRIVVHNRITTTLTPFVLLSDISVMEINDIEVDSDTRFYSNGFQSWTFSKEYMASEKYTGTHPILRPAVRKAGGQFVGDCSFVEYPKKKGVINSTSHCYLKQLKSGSVTLYGSMEDRTGYTYFTCDFATAKLYVTRDLEGLVTSTPVNLLDYIIIEGGYDMAFDEYFNTINITSRAKIKLKGYTSWYNYYRNIDEKTILDDLAAIIEAKKNIPDINIFQIDDGYQPYIGDIVDIDTVKFPNGLKGIVDKIHEGGMLAGLWTCPFGATRKSSTFTNHLDWILKDDSGKPLKVGAAWKGFYCLDFYNPAVREYIKAGLQVMVNDWGFDMLKMDFLYCVATHPRMGKTRATVMCEAMEFLRECVGDKLILGCGVPLMPAFGIVDYCRIGADVSLGYTFPLDHAINREIISTRKTMLNTLFRRGLDGRAFMNDPDVFILRDFNTSMTYEQRMLLATVNRLCGSVLFCSDNVSLYDDKARALLNFTLGDSDVIVSDVTMQDPNIVSIKYTIDNVNRVLVYNYKTSALILDKTAK